MNFKVFIRLVLLLVVTFSLVAGVVVGGITLSYRMANKQKEPDIDIGISEDPKIDQGAAESEKKNPNILNTLLLGVDADGYRTDVIILAQYNEDTKDVKMLQIPRDTKIETFRSDKKINSAYAFGKEEELFTAVKNLIDIDVNKYVLVNLRGFRTLVDEIGGVKVNVPINMNYTDPIQGLYIRLSKGEQILDGKKAEMLVRFRHNSDGTGYPDGDVGRLKVQKEFINAVMDKTLSLKNIFKIPKLVAIVIKNIKTNFDAQDIYKYIDDAFKLDKEKLTIMTLPGEGRYIGDISYFIHDKEETKNMIDTHFKHKEYSVENNEEIESDSNIPNQEQQNQQQQQQKESKDIAYKPSWLNKFIKVEILNGSDEDSGSEQVNKISEYLKSKGFNVVRIGKLEGVYYSKTKAVDRTTRGYSKQVAKALGQISTGKDLDKNMGVDVTVIVGNDRGGMQ